MGDMDAGKTKALRVLVVGGGPVGLINARTLIQDGFDVALVCKEDGPGGIWQRSYPDLHTNNPWGAFDFSGLAMPRPSNNPGLCVPARTYRRYLEDFFEYFVKDQAEVSFKTAVSDLSPLDGRKGWRATLINDGKERTEEYDRVVLAVGYLGKPRIPELLKTSPLPVFHTASLSDPDSFAELIKSTPKSTSLPNKAGDDETVVVLGSGKSGMDMAAILANRGLKVVIAFRGQMKWFSPLFPPGMMGAGWLDTYMGPKRKDDNWFTWFYNSTWLGAKLSRKWWAGIKAYWSSIYSDKLPQPTTDPFLTLPHFGGGVPQGPKDFKGLVESGHIVTLPFVNAKAIKNTGITFASTDPSQPSDVTVRCGAIVSASGYEGGLFSFIDPKLRARLGLEKSPPKRGWETRIKSVRRKWTTVDSEEVKAVPQPLVYRGALPSGRWEEKDLAIAGATRPLSIPATTYEVESHWISSMFQEDPNLRLPKSRQEILDECHADNEFNLARYPGIDPYALIGEGSYFAGFNDQYMIRCQLRDMSLDPWRQKSSLSWWNAKRWFGDWLDVRIVPEQYATIGEERRKRWNGSSV